MISKKNITQIAFAGLGAFCIAMAYIFSSKQWTLGYDITKDLGIIFLSFVILDFLWSIAGEDFSKTKMAQYGLKDIYENPPSISDKLLIERINLTEEKIDLLGYTLSYLSTSRDICKALEKKIIAGIQVRIGLLSIENPILLEVPDFKYLEYPFKALNDLKTSIDIFKKLQNKLGCDNFELKFIKNRPISFSLRRFDDEMMIVPYINNINTIDSPVFVIKGKRKILFQKYMESFENLLSE